jgi:hypothetical protein
MMFIPEIIPSSRFFHATPVRLLFVLALLELTPNPVAAIISEDSSSAADESCPMWLAPSNMNSESTKPIKLGLYAGKLYTQNSTLPLSELAIPLIDFFGDFQRMAAQHKGVVSFLEDQVWTQEYVGSHFEGTLASPAIIPGIGLVAAYHTGFSNADFLHAAIHLRDEPPQQQGPKAGEAHLMRGTITPYFNATLEATQTIPAGMEILPNFGSESLSYVWCCDGLLTSCWTVPLVTIAIIYLPEFI